MPSEASYMCCDMGIFDFFRRSSRSHSKSTVNESEILVSTNSEVAMETEVLPPQVTTTLKESLDSIATTESTDSTNDESEFGEIKNASGEQESLGSIQNYEIVRELGRGATAVVQLGKQKDGNQLVAFKVLKTSLLKKMRDVKRVGRRMVVSTALDKVQVEIAIMKKLKHMNLLNLIEVFDDDSETLVLMLEYAPHGQVMQWDSTSKTYRANTDLAGVNSVNGVFEEDALRDCVRQLLLGLEYLHKNHICHRDLKPENILIGADGVYKIADFGVAHLFEDEAGTESAPENNQHPSIVPEGSKKKGFVSSTAGTYAFMGPETLKGTEYSAYDADVWALGITIYALAFGKIPYYHTGVVELFEMIETKPVDFGDSDNNNNSPISEGLVTLLRGMLEKNAEQRWSIQKCKEHPWVLEGLSDEAKNKFLDVHHEQVTVGPEDVARAVTRVTSMSVLLRVQLGANKWKRKAMKSLEMKKRASLAAQPAIKEDSSEHLSDDKTSLSGAGPVPAADNQLEL